MRRPERLMIVSSCAALLAAAAVGLAVEAMHAHGVTVTLVTLAVAETALAVGNLALAGYWLLRSVRDP